MQKGCVILITSFREERKQSFEGKPKPSGFSGRIPIRILGVDGFVEKRTIARLNMFLNMQIRRKEIGKEKSFDIHREKIVEDHEDIIKKLIYRTRVIISRSLYIFEPIFEDHTFVLKNRSFRKLTGPYVWIGFKSGL